MRLRALHLTNVRKFTGRRASINGIGSGITVVSEANEFGKSTFFDAIHALFFEKYGSTARPVKSLQPYAGGGVEVAAEVETEAGAFLVEKRFMTRKMARVLRLPDRTILAQDDEAERWIAGLLGPAGEGPAGLLWVRQGLLGLEPAGVREKAQLTETRRDLLSSVAGEIDAMTGGRRMDRVMRRCSDDLAEITTKTGRKSGVWKAAADEVEALEAELGALQAQLATLEGALAQRKVDEALLQRLDHPEARARRDEALRAAQAALETARAHAGLVTAARQDRDIADLQARGARQKLDDCLAAIAALATATAMEQAAKARAAEAESAAAVLKQRLDAARHDHDTARESLARARAALDTARHQADARKARDLAAQLAARITKAEAAQADRAAAAARVKASPASADWLARVEASASAVDRLEAALLAQTATLQVVYSGALRISLNGIPVAEGQPVPLDGDSVVDLPGIGQMTLRSQPKAAKGIDDLAKAKDLRDGLLAKAGAATVEAARRLAADRAEAVRQEGLSQALLETLAPDGLAALQAAWAEAALAAADAPDTDPPALADLLAAQAAADLAEDRASKALRALEADHGAAREEAVKARAAADTAAQAVTRAAAAAGPAETRDTRQADLLRDEAQARALLAKAEADLARIAADAPDLTTTEAELKRAEDAARAAAQQRAAVAERLAALSAQIRTLAGNGIEERCDDIRGQLDTARATEARLARKAAALTRLLAALEGERKASQETYFGPVQQELKPLLSILHRDAALTFDSESLLPAGLTRGQAEETLEDLSGGTREQIAILTRLAFARLFARHGRHMPIVLDDALVYSDDDRIIKMFTALTRVAQDQQILVFSCRQLAFQDLGGARPAVEISEV
ncbi:AAA family ATPase [bacterium]|nr:AAA family ATPase [bacterium]